MTVRITSMTDASDDAADEAELGALRTERGNLPLDRIDVRAEITGLTSRVELTQDFVNAFDVALEASYVLPLPHRAGVTVLAVLALAIVLVRRRSARRASSPEHSAPPTAENPRPLKE